MSVVEHRSGFPPAVWARIEEILGLFREAAIEPWVQRGWPGEEALVEAWHGRRKLSVYLETENVITYLKVWGPNITTQMEGGRRHRQPGRPHSPDRLAEGGVG